MSEGRSASFLHAFVIFFYSALLVNVLYPTFLLRTRARILSAELLLYC